MSDALIGDAWKLVVPKGSMRQRILREVHDSVLSGHLGRDRTEELLRRQYWWPNLHGDVAKYVRTCPKCQKT